MYKGHLRQVQAHFKILSQISELDEYWDWKVAGAFYISSHLICAHVLKTYKTHYGRHKLLKEILNPYRSGNEEQRNVYLAFMRLHDLYSKTRYLSLNTETNTFEPFAKEKHYYKSLKNLSFLMDFFEEEYHHKFKAIKIKTTSKMMDLKYFQFQSL